MSSPDCVHTAAVCVHRGLGVQGVGLAVHRRAWVQRQIWLAIYRWVWSYLCLAEADLGSCLQMGVELCLAEADLGSCLQMGVELCHAEADLASYLHMFTDRLQRRVWLAMYRRVWSHAI